ncbi:MAG: HAD family hydrolase [Clostridia bacterium]|nr:HAD family hydrolase [Clostridia bacterium]
MIKAVFFDLDGTLLPLDQDFFVKTYFKRLAAYLVPYGYEPEKTVKAIYTGSDAMVNSDGKTSNEDIFWATFESICGEGRRLDSPIFERFYETDFENVRAVTDCDSRARAIVSALRGRGIKTVLATNPVFPRVATEARMRWAGLSADLFDIVTTYENSFYCKPNPEYYLDLCRRIGALPSECVMVGNDVDDDMIAETLGFSVFLHTDRLVNRRAVDISHYSQGNFDDMARFLGVDI